jgi:hypothetical protein
MKKQNHSLVLLALTVLLILACGTPVATQSASTQPVESQPTDANPEKTAIPPPTATAAAGTTQEATASTAAQCSILQDLNLRIGPGTAYRPIIRVLPANSVVTPLGYIPQGFRGGDWAYVQNTTSADKGWISAGQQYVSCNIDLASLPPVAFGTPPPPPLPKNAQASPGPGTCGEGGVTSDNGVDVYDCIVNFQDDTFVQLTILKNGQEIRETSGVQNVVFTVTQNDNPIYTHTEQTYKYCIFGGEDSCNPWVLEDYVYKWERGGAVVQVGTYRVSIIPTLDDPSVNLFWSADVTIALP